jgi:hypothetical protein
MARENSGLKAILTISAQDEDGAVTVDWVVLTAAFLVVGGLMLNVIGTSLEDLSSDIDRELSSVSPG